jgi:hypothetical protein
MLAEAYAQVDRDQTLESPQTQVAMQITRTQVRHRFIPWFSSPLRLAYIHVVKDATKALGLFQPFSRSQVKGINS